jgi:5-methyltetrahydrofolate--homocysteine methyltransferase
MKAAMALLEPELVKAGVKPLGKFLIGTVKGDLHDIGKNLVAMMLKGAGFEVIDLGVDVPPDKFVEKARSMGVQLVGMSALLTTTMPAMEKTLTALRQAGLDVKIMVGGAPVTQAYADKIGADGYAPNAAEAVTVAKCLIAA